MGTMRYVILLLVVGLPIDGFAQNKFESDPLKAEFITTDIPKFWEAFDQINSKRKPFKDYIENGSVGLKDFIQYRIESAKHLRKVAKQRRSDYEKVRDSSYYVESFTGQIRESYSAFKNLYPDAVFPPTYFVIGAFNSGGTSSDNGLIIGVEMQLRLVNIPYIVAHELIHFNQIYPEQNTLLTQSVMEGSADFIGEMISGGNINERAYEYGNENEDALCTEFVTIMHETKFHGWLYGSKGKKEGRPNDLGYWMGYKISESYYKKSTDPQKAIWDILNIEDHNKFLEASGYLEKYMND